tara:strand:+ start:343 stop:849 length:507 start_codon:yes stop_codon:yes gene_type:complete
MKNNKNKAVFLDRDGVINKSNGYILDYKNFHFLNGVHQAIKFANKKNYLVIIITNQSAIGRSLMTEKELNNIHKKMKIDLKKYNALIDDIFYSPYYSYSKYRKYRLNKNYRKPGVGLFEKAIKKWNIDINSSIFIGDKITDKMAGLKMNLKFYYKKKISLYAQLKEII